MTTPQRDTVPRIESIKIRNYRALRDLELTELTPLTVFLGPNGSGKSTIFDVFAFLAECFTVGLRKAWDKRNRSSELRSRDSSGPIEFEIKYRERPDMPVITYRLQIDERPNGVPFILMERLQWKRKSFGAPYRFLDFANGQGTVTAGETPDEGDERVEERLTSPDVLAVNTLGQLARNPRVNALRQFIAGWYLSYLNADSTRGTVESGPQERLTETGDNLPNVIQYLTEEHPDQLRAILSQLSRRVPRLESVSATVMQDGRLLLQIKDAPFERPIMAKFASDGTLKMLAYLTVLYDPNPPQLIGIEEPENQLHPRLLRGLAEECRAASARTQLMVTTHSPYFVNGLKPDELWVLFRDEDGYTKAHRASDMPGITQYINDGALLGDLWMEGQFDVGDPLKNAGGPKPKASRRGTNG